MKVKFIIPIILIGILSSCNYNKNKCNEDGSLDEITEYRPEKDYFKSGLKSLHFIIETHPVNELDTIFWKLIDSYGLPVLPQNVADGSYVGESPYDAFDYKHVVELIIMDNKIISVKYNEVHKDGSDKRSDEKYNDQMSITGTSPAIAYPIMEEQLVNKQDMWNVDAVSGATYSLYRFRYAVTLALIKAELRAVK